MTIWRKHALGALLVFLAASFGAAALGSRFTLHSVNTWYPTLRKPAWTPPNSLFGPAWTVLYIQMALAAWLIWRARRAPAPARAKVVPALGAWWSQLALNVAWSWIFFGRRQISGGLKAILALWAAIAATAVLAARVSAWAGGLLVPYLAWATFATLLNARLVQLNRPPRLPHTSEEP